MQDRELASRYAFAGDALTRDTAKQLVAEGNLLREMMRLPGWLHAMQRWDELMKARATLVNARGQALAEAQQALQGRDMARQIVSERLELAQQAGDWLKRREEQQAERVPQVASFISAEGVNQEAAGLALEQRERCRELVRHPGWHILTQHIAARTHGEASRLVYDDPGSAAQRQAAILALKAPVHKIQRLLDLGADAEAAFEMQAKEREERQNA